MGYSNVLRQLGFNNNTVLDGAGACKASQRGHHKQVRATLTAVTYRACWTATQTKIRPGMPIVGCT